MQNIVQIVCPKSQKTVVELECRLDMSLRALEQERDNLDSNLSELAHLNASKQAMLNHFYEIN